VEDTDALHREQLIIKMVSTSKCSEKGGITYIVSSVRVVVNTTEECGRSVLADHLDEEMGTSRVLIDKVRHIVDKAGDEDERTLLRLLLDYMREWSIKAGIRKKEDTYSYPS